MKTIKIHSVNISEKKGTVKKPVNQIEVNQQGVVGDAHAGDWHRQVSLLGTESFEKFGEQAGRKIQYGEFAENLTTEGILLYKTSPLDCFENEQVKLEVTQIGKKCHGDGCAIYREVGNCVMPKEGIFCRVVKHGIIKPGDTLTYTPFELKVRIITLSDRASRGEYEDLSGPAIEMSLKKHFEDKAWNLNIQRTIIPDDKDKLSRLLEDSKNQFDVVITTGGTGIGPRDITVEVVKPMLEKEIPGIMEMIRMKYGAEKPNALLSRGIAGVMGNTLVYTLPGSVKACNEYMNEILLTLQHLIYMMHGIDAH